MGKYLPIDRIPNLTPEDVQFVGYISNVKAHTKGGEVVITIARGYQDVGASLGKLIGVPCVISVDKWELLGDDGTGQDDRGSDPLRLIIPGTDETGTD